MYSYLRFVTAASLIAFGGVIGVGVPALLFSVERPLVARSEISDPTAISCKQQAWLHFDRNCLSRRDLPWFAGRGVSSADTVEVPSEPGRTAEQPLTEGRQAATVLQESVSQNSVHQEPVPQKWTLQDSVAKESVAQEFVPRASVPQEFTPRSSVQRNDTTTPVRATPAPRPAAADRHVAKPAIAAQARLPVAKKAAHSNRIAKRPANEALNAVRKFGDTTQDIPVSAYAADGTRRTIVIRPTSIQDVYYYSAPR